MQHFDIFQSVLSSKTQVTGNLFSELFQNQIIQDDWNRYKYISRL